jgi:hypothetical protein
MMQSDHESTIHRVPELLAITQGLADEFQQRYPELRVMRDGRLQVTLFRPVDFKYLQIVVSSNGVYIVEDPAGPIGERPVHQVVITVDGNFKDKLHGPLALEDPHLIKRAAEIVKQWTKQ